MAAWILDPTLSIESAQTIFRSDARTSQSEESLHSRGLEPNVDTSSHAENFLASSGLKKDANGQWEVDYIVVGGGTAGLVVATRLADSDPTITVCVIEAGLRRDDAVIDVPGLYGMAVGNPLYDWAYKTTPQPELNEREIDAAAGKILGGSSAINYLVRMRASSPEYDAWSTFGAGWDWEGLLPYFRKQECYTTPKWGTEQIFPGITKQQDEDARKNEPKFHGFNGPVHSNNNDMYTDLENPTIKTLNNLGINTNRSPGYGDSTGMFNIETAVDRATGRRSYAANTYADPFIPRRNLFILTSCYATKILFPSKPFERASGVNITRIMPPLGDGDFPPIGQPLEFMLTLRKEVILSAGSYNTPRLLELSGIGNPAILNELGIPTVIDLPGVGENLQEHPFLICDFTVKKDVFTFDRLRNDPSYQKAQQDQYNKNGTGAYATTVAAYGFIKLDTFIPASELDDLEKQLAKEISDVTNPFHHKQLEIQKSYLNNKGVGDVELIMVPKVFASVPENDKSYISLTAMLPHTVSRGTVHITSSDPLQPPRIDPKYLASTFDTKVMVKTAQFIRTITEAEPLRDLVEKPSTPPASVQTEKEFEDYVRNNLTTIQHPVGTASMAPRKIGGVVDANLLVYGTTNLRIADMSIVPLHIATHTAETAYAIGEKAFALISGQSTAT